jgi:hypothetical protein
MARRRTFFSKKVYSPKREQVENIREIKKNVEELGEMYTHTTGWEI